MPHKQKKASNNHAPNNGSPRADKKQQQQQQQRQQLQSGPDGPGDSPVLAPTNYREIHQNEVEALRSIYGDDFEEVKNRRSAWHVSVWSVGLTHVSSTVALTGFPLSAIVRCLLQAPPTLVVRCGGISRVAGGIARDVPQDVPEPVVGEPARFSRRSSVPDFGYRKKETKGASRDGNDLRACCVDPRCS